MDIDFFEFLLNEDESNYLDFKSEQYKFQNSNDDEKSELLKDIVAFANSWRRTDAYILIGVKETKGESADVQGITDHLEDAKLQQFVNQKLNKPISFSYQTFKYGEKQIGVIHIPLQERPFYLKRDYGTLSKDIVYLRRGSSTDKAKLEEISKMGSSFSIDHEVPNATIQLYNIENKTELGKHIEIHSQILNIIGDVPLIEPASMPFGLPRIEIPLLEINKYYYKEFVEYFSAKLFFHPITLILKNTSNKMFKNAHLKIICGQVEELKILDQLPIEPQYKGIQITPSIIGPTIQNKGQMIEILLNVGDIKPKDENLSDTFYLGIEQEVTIDFKIILFADNLSEPIVDTFKVSQKLDYKEMKNNELIELADGYK